MYLPSITAALLNFTQRFMLVAPSSTPLSQFIWAAVQNPIDGWLLNNRNYFLVLRAGSPRSGCRQMQGLVRALFPAHGCLLSVSLQGRRRKTALRVSFMRHRPHSRGPISRAYHLPEAPPPNTIMFRVRFQYVNSEGHTTFSLNK